MYPRFITVDHRAFQQSVAHQIQQRLQVFAALDHPARQGLAGDIDAVSAKYFFEPIQRQAVDVFGGQQHGQHAGAGHALFDQLSRFVSSDRCRFTATARVDLADVFDHADLHRHDFQLFAGFFADDVFTTAARAAQFVFGQFVDDFDARHYAQRSIAPGSTVFSDGLACFKAFDARGCQHIASITGGGRASAQHPSFKWVNTLLGNVKNSLAGTFHAFHLKHAPRYLAEFEYRFNRRFDLGSMIERFSYVALRTPPMPYRLLRLAEVYA